MNGEPNEDRTNRMLARRPGISATQYAVGLLAMPKDGTLRFRKWHTLSQAGWGTQIRSECMIWVLQQGKEAVRWAQEGNSGDASVRGIDGSAEVDTGRKHDAG